METGSSRGNTAWCFRREHRAPLALRFLLGWSKLRSGQEDKPLSLPILDISASDFQLYTICYNRHGCLFAIWVAMPSEAMVDERWDEAPTVVCLRLRRRSPQEMGFNRWPSAGDEVVTLRRRAVINCVPLSC